MKVKGFELSDKNESTKAPYWVIVDIWRNELDREEVDTAASFITGIFFSRESAERYLCKNSHRYSEDATVYCMSGYDTDWGKLIDESKNKVKR